MTNSKTVLDNNVDSNNDVDLEVFENTLQYLFNLGKQGVDILSIISFLIAILITSGIYYTIFKINFPIPGLISLILAILFSLIIVRTRELLNFKNKLSENKSKNRNSEYYKELENLFIKRMGYINLIIIGFKILFINILNDLFILNITFLFSFIIFIPLNLIQLPDNVNLLILISFVFTLFQYYVEKQRNIFYSKVVRFLRQFLSEVSKKISTSNSKNVEDILKEIFSKEEKILNEFKKLLFSNIIFFDEAMYDLLIENFSTFSILSIPNIYEQESDLSHTVERILNQSLIPSKYKKKILMRLLAKDKDSVNRFIINYSVYLKVLTYLVAYLLNVPTDELEKHLKKLNKQF